ncbi:hypothetical protein JTB14_002404 [Gonioctena quinquepunctata]|nr:hypothetical protein JTB14_002404 [Gonioctena quinquepunctata]
MNVSRNTKTKLREVTFNEVFSRDEILENLGGTVAELSETVSKLPKQRMDTGNGQSLIVQGLLDDQECTFTIDAGASRSVVRKDMVEKTLRLTARKLVLETATG